MMLKYGKFNLAWYVQPKYFFVEEKWKEQKNS